MTEKFSGLGLNEPIGSPPPCLGQKKSDQSQSREHQ